MRPGARGSWSGRLPALASLLAGLSLVAGAAAVPPGGAASPTSPEPAPRIGVVAAAVQERPRRPFRHDQHTAVSCTRCHGSGAEHRAPRAWTPAQCSDCHHAPEQTRSCSSCHEGAGPPGALPVEMAFRLSAWEAPRSRTVAFDHGVHPDVACGTCHGAGARVAPETCATCHSDHHRAEAECSSCHVEPPPAVHGREAHLGCGGAGCHADAPLPPLPASRPSCLLCHEALRDHEPGGTCGFCHFVPGERAPGTSPTAGRRPDTPTSFPHPPATAPEP